MLKIILSSCICLVMLKTCIPGSYKSVKIGTQEWMLNNLDLDHDRENNTIQEVKTDSAWIQYGKDAKPCWCYLNNSPENGKKYGKLYNWYALKNLAPKGWHIPSKAEWLILVNYLGGDQTAGNALKLKTDWVTTTGQPSTGDNSSGFTALPGQSRQVNLAVWGTGSTFPPASVDGAYGGWWTSDTTVGIKLAVIYGLDWRDGIVGTDGPNQGNGLSVRCIKD